DRMLSQIDAYLGHIEQTAGPGVILAVAADHGVMGISRALKPNVALAAAGLLVLDASGAPDLARTRAYYHPGTYIVINGAARGGPVKPEDEEAVRRQVTAALLGARDPGTGRPVVLAVIDPRKPAEPATGGPGGGDIYLSM